MPIYEYYCNACKKVSSFLLLRFNEEIAPYCKGCGSKEVRRLMSRVAVLKSEEKRMESMLDPTKFSDLDENDPASMQRFMRRMGKEMGEEMGEGFEEEMAGAFAQGEASPEEDL